VINILIFVFAGRRTYWGNVSYAYKLRVMWQKFALRKTTERSFKQLRIAV